VVAVPVVDQDQDRPCTHVSLLALAKANYLTFPIRAESASAHGRGMGTGPEGSGI
jgi:hypothetical protein